MSAGIYRGEQKNAQKSVSAFLSVISFSPNSSVTKGQMVTFLYRSIGEPGKTGSGAWYADAEKWASKNGLTTGTDTAYGTDRACPRGDVIYYLWTALA